MANAQTIGQCIASLEAAYPRAEFNDNTIRVYNATLKDIDDDLLFTAVLDLITKSKFPPTIAEIRESALGLIHQASGALSAYESWGEVAKLISRYGMWNVPKFPDERMALAIDAIGGWQAICTSENSIADRARYFQAYENLVQREIANGLQLPAVTAYVEKRKELGGESIDSLTKKLTANMTGK